MVDAGRFHYPVIDTPPDTICPRCDLIFNDTAELQRHLASMEYPPPEGHSLVINAETLVAAWRSDLWQKIRDRWRAGRAKRETKTHQTKAWRDEGRRDVGGHELGAEGICQGRQQEHGREATQRRPQDALRTLSQQVREVRGAVFHSDLAATKGKEHGLGPPGMAAFTGLSERGSTVGAANAAGVANLKQTSDDLEGAFDLVPHCKLAKVYDPALSRLELVISVAQHREHMRGALGQTGANRLFGQAPSGALERALSATHQSDRGCGRLIEHKVLRQMRNSWIAQQVKRWVLVAAQSPLRLDSCLFWLRSRRFGGSRAGHWTRSWMLRKTQHVKCFLRATSDGWQACLHGIRSHRRTVTD